MAGSGGSAGGQPQVDASASSRSARAHLLLGILLAGGDAAHRLTGLSLTPQQAEHTLAGEFAAIQARRRVSE